MRSLKMTADPTGELPLDWDYAWQGLDQQRFADVNAAQDQVSENGVSLAHNRLMDP
jgi:hypothetical protein